MVDVSAVKSLIDQAGVVSFDIFDTLIMRSVSSPKDVFSLMASGAWQLSNGKISDFRAARSWAEKTALGRAQESGREEITFDEIYDVLVDAAGISGDEARAIQQLEIDTEVRCCHPREIGHIFYEYARFRNKRIILVSDMYLPRTAIEALLSKAGVSGYETLYLSNELFKTKRVGDLFTRIFADLEIAPARLVHLGDNPRGDFETPKSLGVEAVQLPRSIVNYREANEFAAQLSSTGEKLSSLTKSVVDALVADRFFDTTRSRTGKAFFGSDPFQFGYSALGPLIFGLCTWIYREAKRDGVERLYFLSRDGLVMKDVFDTLFPADAYGIETRYLYCSRRATRVPAMQSSFDFQQPVGKPIFSCPLGDWLSTNYGIDPDAVPSDVYEKYGFTGPQHSVGGKVDRTALGSLIKEIEPLLAEAARKERETMQEYLAQEGLGTGNHAVVDIGYAGTMQQALAELTGADIKGYYLAVFGTAAPVVKNPQAIKGFVSQFGADNNPAFGICSHRFIYESLICCSDHSVVRMAKEDGRFVPVTKEAAYSESRAIFVEYAHSGAVALAREFRQFSPIRAEDTLLSPEASTLSFDLYLRQPLFADVALLHNISFDDPYGARRTRFLAADENTMKLITPDQIIWRESLLVAKPKQKTPTRTDDPAALVVFAKQAMKSKDFIVAGKSYEDAFKLDPTRPNYLRAAAEAYYSGGRRMQAVRLLQEARRKLPTNRNIMARMAVMTVPGLGSIIGQHKFNIK